MKKNDIYGERWKFERSSGYAGYRCIICGIWRYANEELICNCNSQIANKIFEDYRNKQ